MRRWCFAAAVALLCGCDLRARTLAPIRLEPIETLGATKGDGVITAAPQVSAALANGDHVVVANSPAMPSSPIVFGPHGTYIGPLHGGTLNAPIFARTGPGDSIWVFDASQHVFVFDSGRTFRRTVSLPFIPWDAVILADSRMVLSPATADHPFPLLIVGPNGDSLRSIGSVGVDAVLSPRWLLHARDGSFWTMPSQYAWQLEHWDSLGARITLLRRTPDWFAPYSRQVTTTATTPPQSTIQGNWLDAAGRIWILGQTADPHWTAGLGADSARAGGTVIQDPDKAYDSVIEAIDPITGQVVAMARFDQWYDAVVEPGVVLRVIDARSGWKEAELNRVVWHGRH